jgi:predicted branched-subunit amino acid permease
MVEKMLAVDDRKWRLGYYFAPSALCWIIWQVFGAVGVFAAASIPKNWSLEFMATIALLVLLVPMAKSRPMLVAAFTGGAMAILLRGLPLRLGMIVAIFAGIGRASARRAMADADVDADADADADAGGRIDPASHARPLSAGKRHGETP